MVGRLNRTISLNKVGQNIYRLRKGDGFCCEEDYDGANDNDRWYSWRGLHSVRVSLASLHTLENNKLSNKAMPSMIETFIRRTQSRSHQILLKKLDFSQPVSIVFSSGAYLPGKGQRIIELRIKQN